MSSVYQRQDGRWAIDVHLNGKRKTVYGKTRAEAKRKAKVVLRDAITIGTLPKPGTRTLNDLLDLWLETASLRPKTLHDYRKALDAHVRDAIGYLRLSQLEAAHLQKLYSRIPGKRQPNTVHRILHRALKEAVRMGWLGSNPAERVTPPTYSAPRKDLWTENQLQIFLDAIQGHKYEALWRLALSTGLRLGELLGLQWDDLDLEPKFCANRRKARSIGPSAVARHLITVAPRSTNR